jgi:DNA mismatch repair protein MutL
VPDIIHLLSDHIANQIAAGEVIQRPASAVKELLENAIDAGATDIQLHLRDAGKELIQVIDNGKGMSPADARMAFERHATSKIRDISDLFRIRTMGFRGEALASVAAVAQVELRTRPHEREVGTRIVIEGTEVKTQEPTGTPPGTNLMIKNLFFNVPARRHFLKSNTTEFRHVVDEFTRVAMAHPAVGFRLYHNNAEQFHLYPGNLKTRIVSLLGNSFEKHLVPVQEDTDLLKIHGFIGKPDAATKTRGNQFFFINNRFIRSPFLHHAVTTAYQSLIEKDSFPFYVLFLEIDPKRVDVNVHPTKQEVKFEDEQLMYAYLQSAIKHALARYNISPSLDFTLDTSIQSLLSVQLPTTERETERTREGYLYNSFSKPDEAHRIASLNEMQRWKDSYQSAGVPAPEAYPSSAPYPAAAPAQMATQMTAPGGETAHGGQSVLVVQGSLLVTTVKSGLLVVHLRRARERIWFERLEEAWQGGDTPSQRLLFPISLELPLADATLLSGLLPDLKRVGFEIEAFGAATYVIQGMPPGMGHGEEQAFLAEILERMKNEAGAAADVRAHQLMVSLAQRLSRGSTATSSQEELRTIVDELFACKQPEFTATGKKVFAVMPKEDLDKWLAFKLGNW